MNNAPTPSEVRANAESRYQQSRQRLFTLLAARQQYANELQAKQEAEYRKQQAELEAQQAESQKGWLNSAGTGALIGANFGPVGSGVGAGLGFLAGVGQSRQQYKKEGKKHATWDAISHPFGDKFSIQDDIPMGQMLGLGSKYAASQNMAPAKAPPVTPSSNISSGDYTGVSNKDIQLENADMEADFASKAAGMGGSPYDPEQYFRERKYGR